MRYSTKFLGLVLAAGVGLGANGCATRGFVRTQVADLRRDMAQQDTELSSGVQQAKGAADDAANKAAQASNEVQSARDMALGHVGYQEAKRFRVLFAYNSDKLDDNAQRVLSEASAAISQGPNYLVELYGFCDPKGSEAYNFQLGQRRAVAVFRALAAGTPGQLSRYQWISYGKEPPDSEKAGWGDGAQRRQVAVVLVERTPPQTRPAALTQK